MNQTSENYILIPGRTSRQGTSLNQGKDSTAYREEINTLLMNPQDMQKLGLADGDRVRMWNDVGNVVVPCKSGKQELPLGMLFISYGDISSRLMGGETHGSGMPDSKGLDVSLEKHADSDD